MNYVIYSTVYKGYLVSYKIGVRKEIVWKPQISMAMRLKYSDALKLKEELGLEHTILRGVE